MCRRCPSREGAGVEGADCQPPADGFRVAARSSGSVPCTARRQWNVVGKHFNSRCQQSPIKCVKCSERKKSDTTVFRGLSTTLLNEEACSAKVPSCRREKYC